MALETTDTLAWIVVGLFAASALLDMRDDYERVARAVAGVSWALFALFWALLVPHFWFEQKSVIETVLIAAAVPGSLYVAYLVYATRPSLMILSRAVAVMGLIYLPVLTINGVERALIAMTARDGAWLQNALGYHPQVLTGPTVESSHTGFPHAFLYVVDGHRYLLEVLVACTGVGSISIVAGIIIALRAPIRRRLLALGVAVPVIYGLNVVRVSFIAIAHGNQWFEGALSRRFVELVFSPTQTGVTSYYMADRVIAQSLSVVALVALTFVLLRLLPELGTVVRDLLYLATGREYDVSGRD